MKPAATKTKTVGRKARRYQNEKPQRRVLYPTPGFIPNVSFSSGMKPAATNFRRE